jgi:YtkA-like
MKPTLTTTKRRAPRKGRSHLLLALFLFPLAGLHVAGCGGEPAAAASDAFPVEPYATVTSAHGGLALAVRTGPTQPPERGLVDVEITARDASSRPVSGLRVSVVPWMPAMGHGAATAVAVEPRDGGRYVARGIGLFMAGRWELRTSFEGAVHDDATIPLQIP